MVRAVATLSQSEPPNMSLFAVRHTRSRAATLTARFAATGFTERMNHRQSVSVRAREKRGNKRGGFNSRANDHNARARSAKRERERERARGEVL